MTVIVYISTSVFSETRVSDQKEAFLTLGLFVVRFLDPDVVQFRQQTRILERKLEQNCITEFK